MNAAELPCIICGVSLPVPNVPDRPGLSGFDVMCPKHGRALRHDPELLRWVADQRVRSGKPQVQIRRAK